jgi:exodeoxyribonuclease VII large subunit
MVKQIKLDLGIKKKDDNESKESGNGNEAKKIDAPITFHEDKEIFTVSGITYRIKRILEHEKSLMDLWIRGEISNLTKPGSGHLYFTLKDEESSLASIMFKEQRKRLRFELDHGMKILAHGHIGVYPPQGKYQFIVDEIQPDGAGALHLAFIQLKEKLVKEGLFDEIHKKSLPEFPKVIGIATSLTGAALRDMINIISRRFPAVTLYCIQTQVQGEGAADSIVNSIRILDDLEEVDIIIIGRGGGSLEDLWVFNEEPVVRAIFKANHPVVSAVGHQTDFTLSDFVSDVRAPTPSAAAEIVVPDRFELLDELNAIRDHLKNMIINKLNQYRIDLNNQVESFALQRPFERVYEAQQQLDELEGRNLSALRNAMKIKKLEYQEIFGKLGSLDPASVLKRGYSITVSHTHPGEVIGSVEALKKNLDVEVIMKDGQLICKIESLQKLSDPVKKLLMKSKSKKT